MCEEFQSGKNIKAEDIKENAAYPVYGGNGLRGYSDTYNHDGVYALVGRQGALCGNMNISFGKAYFTEHAVAVKANTSSDTEFLFYLLGKMNLGQYSSQSAQPGLAVNKLIKLSIFVPSRYEQKKISELFVCLDSAIALHQRKLIMLNQLKQTYLHSMFPQNDESVPTLRFTGFNKLWEQRKLGDVSERVRGNDGRMDLPTLTISAGSGWLDQRERFSGNIAGKEQKNYTLLSKGELSYNHGNSKLAKYGVVFSLRTFEEALVPRVYHSFKTTKEASADFIEYMFATNRPDRELAKLISSGARMDGLLNINYDEFVGINIMLPGIDEQNRISKFLRQLDDTIALHQKKLNKLLDMKQAFLGEMFI